MTPLFQKTKVEPFKDSHLEELESFSLDGNMGQNKNKRMRKNRPRLPSSWYIIENELEGIIQANDSEQIIENQSDAEIQYSNQDSQNIEDNKQNSQQSDQQGQNDKHSNTLYQASNYEFKCPEWQAPNPKKQLITKLKSVLLNNLIITNEQKIELIKETVGKYLCQYEKFYFQQSLLTLSKEKESVEEIAEVLIKGVQQTFKRVIKGLSFQKRRLKVLRYLDKKKRRVWRKKVSYDCRKKVADGRLRIKGKFVTYQQACEQLGLPSIEGYTPDQIKDMLYKKLQHS